MLQTASKTFLRTQSDARLAALAAAGNEVAFAAIVERHSRMLAGACRRVLPEARVEDAVQQAFMAAWSALRRGDDVRELRPWLLRIARNTALNALRVTGYDHDILRDSLQATEAPPAELERREVIRSTLAGLAALPESQREALLGSAVHGTPHADIARELGVSEGAVRQLVLRARMTLRAAASAVVPLPAVKWLAAAGQHGEPSTARIAELAAGAAPVGAGVAAVLAKTSAVVVIAGGAAVTPALVERVDRHRNQAPVAPAVVERSGAANGPAGEAHASHTDAYAPLRPSFVRASRGGDGPDPREDREGDEGRDDERDDDGRRARRRAQRERDEDGYREVVRRGGAASADRDVVDELADEAGPGEQREGAEPPTVAPAPAAAAAPTAAPGPPVPQPAVVTIEPDETQSE